MHKKFEINRTKIKGGCQSGRKEVTHNSKSDLPLELCYAKLALLLPTRGIARLLPSELNCSLGAVSRLSLGGSLPSASAARPK